jgi:hypothetical protein
VNVVPIRASSFGDLFDCPARWAYIHLREGSGERTQSARAWLGTSVHHATAVFDQSRIDGSGVTDDDAAGAFMDFFDKPDMPIRWLDLEAKEAKNIGLILTTRYCQQISPTIEWTAVELKLEPLDIDMGKLTLRMTGTCDRIRREFNARGISDVKTGARIVSDGKVNAAKHIYQLAAYEIISQMAEATTAEPLDLPAQVIGLPTSGSMQPEVGYVEGASGVLTGDAENKGLLEMARDMIQAGNFYGNPRSSLCSETWCPAYQTCRYIGNGPKRKKLEVSR